MKKLTKQQQAQRSQDIINAMYTVRLAVEVNQLVTFMPYHRGIAGSRPTRRPELMAIAETMTDQATEMLIKALDGTFNGKKIPNPRKAPV